jgi:hypothetical protein
MAASAAQSRLLEWIEITSDVIAIKATFLLGHGQSAGLTTAGIARRFLDMAKANPATIEQSGSVDDIQEEQLEIIQLKNKLSQFEAGSGPEPHLELDTTMTLVRCEGKVAIFSPAAPCASTFERIDAFGTVDAIIAPNVQHWLFMQEFARQYPQARVFLSDPTLDEDLAEKLPGIPQFSRLQSGERQVFSTLTQTYLEGATQAMHEMLFLHEPSETLITSDAFYPGYPTSTKSQWRPGWFARAWFKLTKAPQTYTDATLPIYRTARVASAGSPSALLTALEWIDSNWQFKRIISAHGYTPYEPSDAKAAFKDAWVTGCKLGNL